MRNVLINTLLWFDMKFFREFIKNYKATYLLKKRYYKITSVVGILSVAAGVAIMVVLAFYVGPMLGFDPNAKIGSSSIEKFALFVAVMSFFKNSATKSSIAST